MLSANQHHQVDQVVEQLQYLLHRLFLDGRPRVAYHAIKPLPVSHVLFTVFLHVFQKQRDQVGLHDQRLQEPHHLWLLRPRSTFVSLRYETDAIRHLLGVLAPLNNQVS